MKGDLKGFERQPEYVPELCESYAQTILPVEEHSCFARALHLAVSYCHWVMAVASTVAEKKRKFGSLADGSRSDKTVHMWWRKCEIPKNFTAIETAGNYVQFSSVRSTPDTLPLETTEQIAGIRPFFKLIENFSGDNVGFAAVE